MDNDRVLATDSELMFLATILGHSVLKEHPNFEITFDFLGVGGDFIVGNRNVLHPGYLLNLQRGFLDAGDGFDYLKRTNFEKEVKEDSCNVGFPVKSSAKYFEQNPVAVAYNLGLNNGFGAIYEGDYFYEKGFKVERQLSPYKVDVAIASAAVFGNRSLDGIERLFLESMITAEPSFRELLLKMCSDAYRDVPPGIHQIEETERYKAFEAAVFYAARMNSLVTEVRQ